MDASTNQTGRSPRCTGLGSSGWTGATPCPARPRSLQWETASSAPRNRLETASCAAPTQKGESPPAPRLCAVPVVPQSTAATETKAMPTAEEEAEELRAMAPCCAWRGRAFVEKRS